MHNFILIKQKKSCIRQSKKNILFLKSLGLKKINHQRLIKNNHSNRCLINKVQHLILISTKQ